MHKFNFKIFCFVLSIILIILITSFITLILTIKYQNKDEERKIRNILGENYELLEQIEYKATTVYTLSNGEKVTIESDDVSDIIKP